MPLLSGEVMGNAMAFGGHCRMPILIAFLSMRKRYRNDHNLLYLFTTEFRGKCTFHEFIVKRTF